VGSGHGDTGRFDIDGSALDGGTDGVAEFEMEVHGIFFGVFFGDKNTILVGGFEGPEVLDVFERFGFEPVIPENTAVVNSVGFLISKNDIILHVSPLVVGFDVGIVDRSTSCNSYSEACALPRNG